MEQPDLSYAFQPVIHEPLSKVDGSSFGVVNKSKEEVTSPSGQGDAFLYFVESGESRSDDIPESYNEPLSPRTKRKEEIEALQCQEEAHKCRINHPRKAMSLYLKAGKALVLCSEAESALDCFRCLVVLASSQLTKVMEDKKKLPALPRSKHSQQDKFPLSRSQSMGLPDRQNSTEVVDERRRNSHTGVQTEVGVMEEEAVECVQATDVSENQVEFASVVVVESDSSKHEQDNCVNVPIVINCCEDTVVQVNSDTSSEMCMANEVTSSEMCMANEVTSSEMCMANEVTSSEMCMANEVTSPDMCTANEVTAVVEGTDMCHACVVECVESSASLLEFEVAMVDSDDGISTHSAASTEDIVRTVNAEVVMECGEVMVSGESPASPQQNALIRRGYVVSELIDTEQNYVRDMGHVIKSYMAEVASDDVPSDLKGKEKDIFANIRDIHEWHSKEFFRYLRDCEDTPAHLGDIFTHAESKLEELYTEYCGNKPRSDTLVICHKEAFFQECRQRLGDRLQITDYLIKPVQRITKYQLLLRDILKFTERAGEDGSDIQRALDVALRILKRTNDMISVAMIQGYEAKPEDTGDLILRETLEVAYGKSKQKSGKECNAFLFENILLITEPCEEGGQTSLRYQNAIKVRGIGQTESVDSDPCKWAVWLRKRSSSEIYVLKAPSCEIKQRWMNTIRELSNKKKPEGLMKSAFRRAKTFRRETETKESNSPPTPTSLTLEEPSSQSSTRRSKTKRKTSKVGTKKKKGRESGFFSDRLKENILRFRAEEQMISADHDGEDSDDHHDDSTPNSMSSSIEDTIPPSPDIVGTPNSFADAVVRATHIEERAKLEAEENQLKKVLLLTRMIAARLLQFRDSAQSLGLYSDVIGSLFPLENLRKLETMYNARDVMLQQCTDIYEQWRNENLQSGELEESYTSMTSLLNETAGFCSLHKGTPWSVVLYSVVAVAGSREQRWRNASQAFYRLSLVYSSLQIPWCAVDSLLDAHWICCQAGDHQGAVNFFYNAFIRVLSYRDFLRSLRLEQQALFLMEMLKSKDRNNNTNNDVTAESESRGLVSAQHLSFLVNMSCATRQRDWAWFEIAETELNGIVSAGNGRQADAVLSAVFMKIRRSIADQISTY